MTRSIEISWHGGEAKGYTDVLPLVEFKQEATGEGRTHLVRGPGGGRYTARFRLRVKGDVARLDYRAFADFNRRHGMQRGVLELRFASPSRRKVQEVFWKGQLVPASLATVKLTASEQLTDVVTSAEHRLAKQRLRPGQAQFRQRLAIVYGSRCCISRSTVTWAISAAHIAPYAGKGSNRAANGLLLRSDLHALFDANQLAVHPKSMLLYFSPEAREWPEYREWHGKRRLLKPQAGYEHDAPKGAGFLPRWKNFVREHGTP